MPFTVQIERPPGYVRFRVSGPPSLKNYFDLIENAAQETLAKGDAAAMVDLRGVTGRLPFTDQFFIGDVVAQKLAHLARVACIVAGDPSSYHSERVASRMGLAMQSFSDERQALAWLLSDPARSG